MRPHDIRSILCLTSRCFSDKQRLHMRANQGPEAMRVLLRDMNTGLFFQKGQGWTAARMEARDFNHSTTAIEFAVKTDLHKVEVVFSFDDAQYDVRLPCRP